MVSLFDSGLVIEVLTKLPSLILCEMGMMVQSMAK